MPGRTLEPGSISACIRAKRNGEIKLGDDPESLTTCVTPVLRAASMKFVWTSTSRIGRGNEHRALHALQRPNQRSGRARSPSDDLHVRQRCQRLRLATLRTNGAPEPPRADTAAPVLFRSARRTRHQIMSASPCGFHAAAAYAIWAPEGAAWEVWTKLILQIGASHLDPRPDERERRLAAACGVRLRAFSLDQRQVKLRIVWDLQDGALRYSEIP